MLKIVHITFILLIANSCNVIKYKKVIDIDSPGLQTPDKEKIKKIIEENNCVIIRDNWGVPHIYGKTDADAAFGLAYANAQDDFFTIQETVLKSRGEYASVYGKGENNINAIFDYMVGLLKIWDLVDLKYSTDLSTETIKLCESYAMGINYFIETHNENIDQYIYPVNGKDIIAGTVHKTPFFFQLPFFLNDLSSKKPEEIPSHYTIGEALDIIDKIEGSNVYALSQNKTEDNTTMLAINSHQPWDGELAWYEAHLVSDEGLNIIGGLFPGSPVVLVGHNENLGWGHTVNKPDILDIYELEINPNDELQYRFDDQWLEFEAYDVNIKIKTIGKSYINHIEKAYWSIHGPVIMGKEAVYAIKYSKYDDIRMIEQWYKMNKSKNFKEWKDAMEMMSIPMFNAGYADKDGNIFYIYNASLPIRNNNYNWDSVLPGNTSKTLWNDYMKFSDLPMVLNPKSGFIQNCNSSPFETTIGDENPDINKYKQFHGIETNMTNRALRAIETFGNDATINYEEFKKYKYDLMYSKKSTMNQLVIKSIDLLSEPDFDKLDKNIIFDIIDILKKWDLSTDKNNINAALPIVSFGRILDLDLSDITDELIIEKISNAVDFLIKNHGKLNVRWGDINKLIRGNTILELSGGPDIARAIYTKKEKDGTLKATAGDCYILLARWNEDGKVISESIHQYGSATHNEKSIHYDDQAKLFSEDKLKKTSIYIDEILEDYKNIQILK